MARRPQLHVITDESLQSKHTHVQLARAAAENGADFVQFREKRIRTTAELCEISTDMLEACHNEDVTLVINDRVDVAYAVNATAVHLGAHDLSVRDAREILGNEILVGGTANSLDEARRVWVKAVDYLGVGPVFGTRSKKNPAAPLGLERLSVICSESPKPIVAIGNIRVENVPDVIATGAAGIAVLSAIACDENPEQKTREFRDVLDSCT